MSPAANADFAYGNTRLRARWPDLLGREDLDVLATRDVDGQLAFLADTPAYAPDVETALARASSLPALHRAVSAHLARTLRELPALYEGRARTLVELHLAGWDVHNLLAMLRGRVAGRPAAAVVAEHVDVGAIDTAAAEELARQPTAETLVATLVAWRLPDPETAADVRRAWPEFERTGDLAALERRLAAAHAQRRAVAGGSGHDAEPLHDLLAWQSDARDIVVCLRLREALAAGELRDLPPLTGEHGTLLGAGRARAGRLEEAIRRPDADGVAAAFVAAAPGVPGLRAALDRWARGASPAKVERDLDLAREAALIAGARLDPLGLRVPLGWTAAKTAEARRLRLLAGGAARGLTLEALRAEVAA